MKAMILAAGKGVRMRPLSYVTPKPLLKVGSQRLIEQLFASLKQAGIDEVIINVAYLSEKVIEALGDGSKYQLKITYSIEQEGPYGTGGGIYNALSLLGSQPFLVVSGDLWTDFPFKRLVQQFNKTPWQGDAHLILVKNPIDHPEGDFGLTDDGYLTTNTPKFTYGNIGILHPRLFAQQDQGSFPLAPLLITAINNRRATGELYEGEWNNIGTPEQLRQLQHNKTANI